MTLRRLCKRFTPSNHLTARQKQRIDRFFDDKLRYMVDRSKSLSKPLADSLQQLHRYRNEAYHRNEVRPDTIRAACLILLEINCEMLNIPRAYMSYRSNGDYSWLKERFGIERMLSREEVEGIVQQLRSGLIPETSHIADILADYTEGRFGSFYGELDYIVMNLQQVADQEAALIEAFEYRESRVDNPENEISPIKIERRTLAWFKVREEQVASIRSAKSRLEAFEQFAAIERDLDRQRLLSVKLFLRLTVISTSRSISHAANEFWLAVEGVEDLRDYQDEERALAPHRQRQ